RLLEGIEKFSKAPIKLGDVEIGTYGQFSKFKDTSADKEFLNKLQEYNKLYDEYENANKIGDKNKAIELKAELDKRLSKLKSSNPFYFHNLDVDEYLTQDPDIHFTGWKLQRPFLRKYPVDEKYFDYNKTIAPHRTINKMPSIVRNTVGGLTSGVIMSTVESAYNIG
ncbi:MAG: hypothetical protein N2485_08830, partial [bacterium]|nr:hypothetical protein [bacterium]